jgi:hypothetical protein
MNITTHKHHILLFAALFGLAGSASANLWLSDSFHVGSNNYSEALLGNQNPTTMTPGVGDDFTAYNAAWNADTFGAQFGEPVVVSSGLSYTGILSGGGAIRMERTSANSLSKGGSISLTGTPSGGEGDSVYFSYLLQLGGADHAFAGIRIGPAATKDIITWGMNSNGNAEIRTINNINGTNLVATSTTTFDVNQTVLIVGEILRDGSNTAFLYLNPVANSGKPAQATLEANIGTLGWFPSQDLTVLSFEALLNPNTAATYFDEFRIGETWDSVTPIPEPGTLVLVGITLGAFLIFRKRRG